MNLFDRFILTLYSLALIVVSVTAIGVLSKVVPPDLVQLYMNTILESSGMHIPSLIVIVIFLLISLRFFFSAFLSGKPRTEKSIYQRTELGMVNISLETIKTIAERTAKKVKGVRELKTTVHTNDGGNKIVLRISVDGETSIPEMTQTMQYEVKMKVESITGVEITEVSVVVAEVMATENQSVRTRRLD